MMRMMIATLLAFLSAVAMASSSTNAGYTSKPFRKQKIWYE
jgi:hypothetical protein